MTFDIFAKNLGITEITNNCNFNICYGMVIVVSAAINHLTLENYYCLKKKMANGKIVQ